MTPRQRAEVERLKKRTSLLERRNLELNRKLSGKPRERVVRPRLLKGALDRLIWLTTTIEEKPKADRFVRVPLSASDAKLFRRLIESLVS